MMAGDRVSAELGVAVKANAQNATADAVVIWRIVFIARSNQFEALGVFWTSRPGLIWSPGSEWLTGNFEGGNRSGRWNWHQHRKDDADQPHRIDKYGPTALLAGRQLHAGRSVFLQYMTGGLLGVSLRLRPLAQWAPKLQDFQNAKCDLVGPIYRGGDALSIFIRRNEVTMCRRAEGTSARLFVRIWPTSGIGT
jgi:hypothetical protein